MVTVKKEALTTLVFTGIKILKKTKKKRQTAFKLLHSFLHSCQS